MIIINTVDSTKFTFNGITYFKNFTPVVRGNYIEVVNTYDARLRLTDAPVLFGDFIVDGSTYASVSLLQQALLPILFTRDSLGSGSGVGTLQEVTTNGATSNVETDFTTLVNGKVVTYDGEAVSVFRGEWNASTNTPALDNTDIGVKGFFYRNTVAGTVNFGDGNISFNVGDYVAFEIDKWKKFIDNNQSSGGGVQSVTGDIVNNTDPLNPVINTPSLQNVVDVDNDVVSGTQTLSVLAGGIISTNTSTDTGIVAGNFKGFECTDAAGSRVGRSALEHDQVSVGNLTHVGTLKTTNITANREYQLPNKNGTIALLDDLGKTNVYTFATLPTGVQGLTATITDASSVSYRGVASGGGSDVALVLYDGTQWIYH